MFGRPTRKVVQRRLCTLVVRLVVRAGCALVVRWLCALVVRTGFLRIIAKISAQSVRLCAEVVYTTKLERNLHNHAAQPKKVVGLEWHNQTARLKTPIPVWHNLLRL